MGKITISVSRTYKNSRKEVKHRESTKKYWCHYFIDDFDYSFGREFVNSVKARILKTKIKRKRVFICPDCNQYFIGFVKNDKEKVDCPYCLELE